MSGVDPERLPEGLERVARIAHREREPSFEEQRAGIPRGERHRLLAELRGLVAPARLRLELGERQHRGHVARVRGARLLVRASRERGLVDRAIRMAAQHEELRPLPGRRRGRRHALEQLLMLAEREQRLRHRQGDLGAVDAELQRPPERRLRARRVTLSEERLAEQHVRREQVGILLQGVLELDDRAAEVAFLVPAQRVVVEAERLLGTLGGGGRREGERRHDGQGDPECAQESPFDRDRCVRKTD